MHLSAAEEAAGYRAQLDETLRRVPASPQLARVVPMMMAAASVSRAGVPQVILLGPRDAAGTAALHRALTAYFLPAAVSLVVEPGGTSRRSRRGCLGSRRWRCSTDGRPRISAATAPATNR